jgi:hypothetical protein
VRVIQHPQHFGVGEQRHGPFVVVTQLATDHERRPKYTPERQHRHLFVT